MRTMIALALIGLSFPAQAGFFSSTVTDPATGRVTTVLSVNIPDFIHVQKPPVTYSTTVKTKDNGKTVTITRGSDGSRTKSISRKD